MAKRIKVGSTFLCEVPNGKVLWYVDSCDENGRDDVVGVGGEKKMRKLYEKLKETDYDIRLYKAIVLVESKITGNDIIDNVIDDEVVDSWYLEEE